MSNKKVSIIVPIYNGGNYIQSTLNSILNQTLKDTEVILINDGSTDNSKIILDELSKTDNRIKVLHKPNSGVASTRNVGISLAQGEYICFVDCDDFIEANMYETMYNKAKECNADIVCCGLIEEDENSNTLRTYTYPLYEEVLTKENIKNKFLSVLDKDFIPLGGFTAVNKLYRNEFIKKEKLKMKEDLTVGEDSCFVIECISKSTVLAGVDGLFYHYLRQNPNSIMSSTTKSTYINFIKGRKSILSTLNEYGIHSENYIKYEHCKNIANLIQLAGYKLKDGKNLSEKYSEVNSILNCEDFKESIRLYDNKYLSKNLQLIVSLNKLHLNFLIFIILYLRSK